MSFELARSHWKRVGAVAPEQLDEARLECHWAVQTIAAASRAMADPRPDDSHTAMEWQPTSRCFVGQPLTDGRRVAVRLTDLALILLDAGGTRQASRDLEGHTLDQALSWLGERLGVALARPEYDMPDHPSGQCVTFVRQNPAAHEELACYYANAARFFDVVSATTAGASAVRCWPHHFDIATLITLDPDEPDAEKARSIGVGFSPGDSSYAQPYYYVNPWPRPGTADLPQLEGHGIWHREGWVGAVLPASRLSRGQAREQAEQVHAYLLSGIAACRALLGSD